MFSEYDRLSEMISTTPFDSHLFAKSCVTPQVLDIGCGYGRILDELVELGLWAVGLDLSMTQLLRANAKHMGRLVRATSTALPFEDRTFGGALALGSIDSLLRQEELLKMLKECARVLLPGSPIWLNFYTVNFTDEFQERYEESGLETKYVLRTRSGLTVRHWQTAEVQHALIRTGFEVMAMSGNHFWTMHHNRSVAGMQLRARLRA